MVKLLQYDKHYAQLKNGSYVKLKVFPDGKIVNEKNIKQVYDLENNVVKIYEKIPRNMSNITGEFVLYKKDGTSDMEHGKIIEIMSTNRYKILNHDKTTESIIKKQEIKAICKQIYPKTNPWDVAIKYILQPNIHRKNESNFDWMMKPNRKSKRDQFIHALKDFFKVQTKGISAGVSGKHIYIESKVHIAGNSHFSLHSSHNPRSPTQFHFAFKKNPSNTKFTYIDLVWDYNGKPHQKFVMGNLVTSYGQIVPVLSKGDVSSLINNKATENFLYDGLKKINEFIPVYFDSYLKPIIQLSGSNKVYIKNVGYRKIRYYKNGNKYVIIKGKKKKI